MLITHSDIWSYIVTTRMRAQSGFAFVDAPGSSTSSPKRRMRRKGKWTAAEEQYTTRIIYYFNTGLLTLPEGTTLRAYLAEKLSCDPMRITKKFSGDACLGKRAYHKRARTTERSAEMEAAQEELRLLEQEFLAEVKKISQKGHDRPNDPLDPASVISTPAIDAMLQQSHGPRPAVAAKAMPPSSNTEQLIDPFGAPIYTPAILSHACREEGSNVMPARYNVAASQTEAESFSLSNHSVTSCDQQSLPVQHGCYDTVASALGNDLISFGAAPNSTVLPLLRMGLFRETNGSAVPPITCVGVTSLGQQQYQEQQLHQGLSSQPSHPPSTAALPAYDGDVVDRSVGHCVHQGDYTVGGVAEVESTTAGTCPSKLQRLADGSRRVVVLDDWSSGWRNEGGIGGTKEVEGGLRVCESRVWAAVGKCADEEEDADAMAMLGLVETIRKSSSHDDLVDWACTAHQKTCARGNGSVEPL